MNPNQQPPLQTDEPTDDRQTAWHRERAVDTGEEPTDWMERAKSLRVLNIAMSTPELRAGGADRAAVQLGDHLAAYVDVDNAKMAAAHDDELFVELGLSNPVVSVPSKTWLRDLWNRVHTSPMNYSNTVIWPDFTDLDIASYDLVHIHNAVPLAGMVSVALACKRHGVPYVVTTHGISSIPYLPESMNMSLLPKLAFSIGVLRPYRAVLRNAAHLFALSEGDAQLARELLPEQSVSVVPNGVRLRPLEPDAADSVAERWGIPTDRPMLLFVGKLIKGKGVDDLLAAYEALEHDCTLVVVGPAKDPAYEERLNAYDPDRVKYLGYVGYPELGTLFQRADVFVYPTRSDVFPLVTLEAMAAKTAVVSTTVGGIPTQLSDEAGLLVAPERPDEVAASVDRLLADDTYRSEIAARGYARVEREFSWDGVARRLAASYLDICR